jgi:glutathione S-transferase
MEYVVERFAAGKFAPARNTQAFETYRYWMHYAEGSLMTPLLIKLYLGIVGDAAKPVIERVNGNVRAHLDFIEQALGSTQYLVGEEITAADLQMSFPMELIAAQEMLGDSYPKARAWLKGLHERPAYQRALEKGGPYAYVRD